MYETLKTLAKRWIPRVVLERNESFFRFIASARYRGSKFNCNVCGIKLSSFVKLERGDLLCPNCGSLGRTRRLKSELDKLDLSEKRILHFSPPKSISKRLKNQFKKQYETTDFSNEFKADHAFNILDIDVADGSYDFLICYHVLEHIEDDLRAISELHRILSKGGQCIIQTPFHDEPTLEDATINTPAKRLERYGQADHVRIYNADNLAARFKTCGFLVSAQIFNEQSNNFYGFKVHETILLCTKI